MKECLGIFEILGSTLYYYYYYYYLCIYLSNISRGTQFRKQHEKKRLKDLRCKLVFTADS